MKEMLFALHMPGSRGAAVPRRVTGEGRFVRQMGPPGHSTDSKLSCYAMATALAFRAALTEAGLYATSPVRDAANGPDA